MSAPLDRTDLPVLLLHNFDHSWTTAEKAEAQQEVHKLTEGMREVGHPVVAQEINDQDLRTPLARFDPQAYVVLNWCEGLPGLPWSDALVAETLEELHFTYTGAPPAVLRFCQDKYQVKRRLEAQQVPTPRWRLYTTPLTTADDWAVFPSIVKPMREHCSIGITTEAVVLTPAELMQRVNYVIQHMTQPALVEEFIDGREFHVSLWGTTEVQMLPPAEMDFAAFEDVRDRLCTYESKTDATSRHYQQIQIRLPAPLSPAENQQLEQVCQAAYQALACRDYARLDVRLRDGVFYMLDVNPNADLSSESSLAYAAQVSGYEFGALGSRLVNLAAQRHPQWSQS